MFTTAVFMCLEFKKEIFVLSYCFMVLKKSKWSCVMLVIMPTSKIIPSNFLRLIACADASITT